MVGMCLFTKITIGSLIITSVFQYFFLSLFSFAFVPVTKNEDWGGLDQPDSIFYFDHFPFFSCCSEQYQGLSNIKILISTIGCNKRIGLFIRGLFTKSLCLIQDYLNARFYYCVNSAIKLVQLLSSTFSSW
jgi:hypothetical protein